jgi:hypothetical protein
MEAFLPGPETETLMMALELVELPALMEQTTGRPEVTVGLIGGPVAKDHPDLERENIGELSGGEGGAGGARHTKAEPRGNRAARARRLVGLTKSCSVEDTP